MMHNILNEEDRNCQASCLDKSYYLFIHNLINHRKGHSLALNSHSSKKYSGIHRPKFDLMVRLVSVYQLIRVITDLSTG